jgi:DNA-directed RNA polymerase II subunit RPB7
MFFLKEEERTMTLHPSFFGPNIHQYLSHELLKSVEGTNQGDYYVVCVLDSHEFSEGKSVPGSGRAEYQVHYRAICWRPFKDEVVWLDAASMRFLG